MNIEVNSKNVIIASAVAVAATVLSYGSYRLGKSVKVKLAARKAAKQDKPTATAANESAQDQSKAA